MKLQKSNEKQFLCHSAAEIQSVLSVTGQSEAKEVIALFKLLNNMHILLRLPSVL